MDSKINTSAKVDILEKTALQQFFPITTFHLFHKDSNINFQLNRFFIDGLEEDFTQIGQQIENFDDWKRLFLAKALSFELEGKTDWAIRLYMAAKFFMSQEDPYKQFVYEKFISLFYNRKKGPNFTRIKVPYGSAHLHAFRLTPLSPGKGTIIIHGGFDSYIEEFYSLAMAFCESDYEVIMFDGPGQGTTLIQEKIPMTHEWEKPVAAVLDYLGANEVTLIGISLGGYLALRAASLDRRVKRLIAYDVMLDFFECITSRRGIIAETFIRSSVKLRLAFLLNAIVRVMMKRDNYSKWGISQGMHVMGCKTPYEFFLKLRNYNGYLISKDVVCDVLIMAGTKDHFVPLNQFFKQLKLLICARSVTGRIFTVRECAQSHCQIGNMGVAFECMLAWIKEHSDRVTLLQN